MSDTANLSLPLLAAAQAQKHVTVNEALVRLDAIVQARAISADVATPPAGAPGETWIVAAPASGAWTGREGALAVFVNDGWSFAAPQPGWRVWVEDRGEAHVFDGAIWRPDPLGPIRAGAGSRFGLLTGDVAVPAGGGFDAPLSIPDRAVVFGVTGRVTTALSGAGLTGWRLGAPGAADRYGTAIGLAKDSTVVGLTGAPLAYYGPTPLRIEPEGGVFAGGTIRLAIHFLALTPPDAI